MDLVQKVLKGEDNKMDCFQPIPKPTLADSIIDMTAKHFGIEGDEEKCNLKLLFDLYADIRMKEKFVKAFSKPDCEKG